MKLLRNAIKKIFSPDNLPFGRKKSVFIDSKHIINEAFKSNDVQYYCFDNTFNLPYQRGLAAITVYEELRMKCDYELLKSFTDTIEHILSGSKIGLNQFYELKRMNDIVRERLNWVVDTDLVYKLAAVIYFDASESPYRYDPKYAAEKIERWRNEEDINDFFLREPIQSLIPFLNGSGLNFHEYSAVQTELNKKHREIISSRSSVTDGKSSSAKPSSSFATAMPQEQV